MVEACFDSASRGSLAEGGAWQAVRLQPARQQPPRQWQLQQQSLPLPLPRQLLSRLREWWWWLHY